MAPINQPGIIPSAEVHAYARRFNRHVEWPIREDSAIGNALLHVNLHGLNAAAGKFAAYDGKPVFIDHVMFSERTVNAFATRYKGRYITAIYGALYLNCLDTAFTILGTREALPQLGDHLGERPNSDHLSVGLASERFPSPKAYFEYLTRNMPRCPIRRDAAHVLAIIMLSFVLFHEEAHIFLGDADFATSALEAENMSETTRLSDDPLRARSLHHLSELNADEFALSMILSPLSLKSLSVNYLRLGMTERQSICLSWLGAGLTCSLLEVMDTQDLADPLSWPEHPHALLRARQTMLPSRARQLAEQHPDIDYMNGFVDAWEALDGLAKIWPQYSLFRYAFKLEGQVEQAIVAFNASITESHKRDYQRLKAQFGLRGFPKGTA